MIFTETTLAGAFVIDIERHADERGSFARTYCQREFAAHGLPALTAQASTAVNHYQGTLRGMHFQFPPHAETKLVRCIRGAILDVIVDLRPESPTYLGYIAIELSGDNGRGLVVPERFAHGYQVLEANSEVSYLMGQFYAPDASSGLRYDDPRLGIRWPLPAVHVSARDREWRLLAEVEGDVRRRMAVETAVTES